jgi:hypothetical protein
MTSRGCVERDLEIIAEFIFKAAQKLAVQQVAIGCDNDAISHLCCLGNALES